MFAFNAKQDMPLETMESVFLALKDVKNVTQPDKLEEKKLKLLMEKRNLYSNVENVSKDPLLAVMENVLNVQKDG